ncbi:MAG: translocase [Rhodospirillales bacterium]|jgi:predicted lipid-binding transport protein (Tim44 family)|nr:translocase [Rhodospirillales bacterium]
MGDGFQYFDIILLALVAAFLVLRLRNVLGRRTGTERPAEPVRPPLAKRDVGGDNVVNLTEASAREAVAPAGKAQGDGLAQIRAADPQFDPAAFLQGARGAFQMIVGAFASGDTGTLRPLLSDDVYERFAEAIRQRVAAKETQETNIVSIKSHEISDAELQGRTAFITVKFVSEQINILRAADGTVIEGEPDQVHEKTDFWTFARNLRSQDPNWLLVATRST